MSAPRRVLITRPAGDAGPLALKIEMLGHHALVAPLLDIRFIDAPVDLSGVQALAFTSANGVRALRNAVGDDLPRGLAVFAVGRATAAAARSAGFARIETAAGDVESLATLIAERLAPDGGVVLHVAGRERAGDLQGALETAGFKARRAVLYAAEAVNDLPAEVVAELRDGRIDDVVVFSPRSARQFVDLVKRAGLAREAGRLRLLALSPRVADAAKDMPFATVAVAARADEDALVELLGTAEEEPETLAPKPQLESMAASPPADEPPPLRPPPPAPRTGRVVLVAMLSVVALMVAVAVVVMVDPALRARALAMFDAARGEKPAAVAAPVAALAQRVDRLAAEVAALAAKPAPSPGADPARLDDLARKLAALEGELAALKSRPQSDAPPKGDDRVPDLLALIAALDAGRPFGPHVAGAKAALAALGPGAEARRAALDTLTPWADRGIPTAAMLAARARWLARPMSSPVTAAAAQPATAPPPDASAGLWDRVKSRLAGLVTIRRVAEKPPGAAPPATAPPTDQLSVAADQFTAGEVTAALAALLSIDTAGFLTPRADALARLIAEAEARLAADRVASGPVAPPR